jgi:hypothetical protein
MKLIAPDLEYERPIVMPTVRHSAMTVGKTKFVISGLLLCLVPCCLANIFIYTCCNTSEAEPFVTAIVTNSQKAIEQSKPKLDLVQIPSGYFTMGATENMTSSLLVRSTWTRTVSVGTW